MPNHEEITRHIQLLHVYHLDLWAEIEAQLRTLRASQAEIEKLRNTRSPDETIQVARASANVLWHHVATMKGRINTLGGTIAELETTVAELRNTLASDTDGQLPDRRQATVSPLLHSERRKKRGG